MRPILVSAPKRRARWAVALAAAAMTSVLPPASAGAQSGEVQVHVGDSTVIELDGNPSTGFAWALDDGASENPERVQVEDLSYVKRELKPGERPVLGAPSKQQFRVTGLEVGNASLHFYYARGREGTPAKSQDVSIEVTGE